MINFNGVDLEDIAPVRIDDIKVSPMDAKPVTRQNVGVGQTFVRMSDGQRTITITFALLIEDKNERFQALEAIKAWARPWEEFPLILPQDESKHFDCRCTEYPDPSYRQWWESKLKLVFTTFENPYWTSNDEIRANTNQQFTIAGTAPPLIRIERRLTSRVSNQTYAANGQSMFFTEIPAGQLVIDLNRQTAEVSGASIMQYFGKTSRFIKPVTGNMTITGNGTIIYRERWV
ncbi:MAG: phage tail family protein [Acidaminococcaceae bacterium]|nr:phage tail family protein [Acidaminococcaceae bacterium]